MKLFTICLFLFTVSIGNTQTLPIDFETTITTSNFENFSGGTGTVIANPQVSGINTSAKVGQIVRDGGEIWAGSKILLENNLDFSTLGIISMKVFSTAPIGTTVKFKLEGNGATELDVLTTKTNEWETLTWDFIGTPANYNYLVFMFDFGNVGDGSATSTFLFDDIEQLQGLAQIDWPVDFEGSTVNYTTTDFGGNVSSLVTDPTDPNNKVIQAIKTDSAATWAGTTIGRPSGFATDLPLTLTDSKMTVRVWSPDADIPVRLKVEDSDDPTHTCETETRTTVAGAWETLEFDFANEAPGTAMLTTGLSMGWTYNMASIFFNFDTEGAIAGEKTYYFDDVKFGELVLNIDNPEIEGLTAFPNPSNKEWTISSINEHITCIEVFDALAKRVLMLHPNDRIVSIDVSSLTNGVYFLKVSTNSATSSIKLVKE